MTLSCVPGLLRLQNVTQRFLIDQVPAPNASIATASWDLDGVTSKEKSSSIARIAVVIDSKLVQMVVDISLLPALRVLPTDLHNRLAPCLDSVGRCQYGFWPVYLNRLKYLAISEPL